MAAIHATLTDTELRVLRALYDADRVAEVHMDLATRRIVKRMTRQGFATRVKHGFQISPAGRVHIMEDSR